MKKEKEEKKTEGPGLSGLNIEESVTRREK